MSITIANRRFSLVIAQRRLSRALAAFFPEIFTKSDSKRKIQRLKKLAAGLDLSEPVKIVDVGANPLDYDSPYQSLLDAGLCSVIGFEPQAGALDRLNSVKSDAESYFAVAVGDGNIHTLYDYEHGGLTSLFPLDDRAVRHISLFNDCDTLESSDKIPTVRLDDIDQIDAIDFLKIDIQGGELMVFENCTNKLATALAVQTEFRYLPFYVGEPRLGDVDIHLGKAGFEIHCAMPFIPLGMQNSQKDFLSNFSNRQILDGDVMYIRKLRELEKHSDIELKKLAVLADAVFDSVQLTIHCIDILAERGVVPNSLAKTYRKSLPARYRR